MTLIKKKSLWEAVYQELLNLIKTGEFRPGEKLPPEPELCRMLGVSRTALREGIRALALINVLTVSAGRGTFVHENPDIMVDEDALEISLDRETFERVYEVRTVLGVGVARYAAMKARQQDITALGKAVDLLEASILKEPFDVDLAIKADEAFHLTLCHSTHNSVLKKMAWPIESHVMLRNWQRLRGDVGRIPLALAGHKRILEAVKKRDPRKAMEEMEQHLDQAYGMMLPRDQEES